MWTETINDECRWLRGICWYSNRSSVFYIMRIFKICSRIKLQCKTCNMLGSM
jgi:hypothetical protein